VELLVALVILSIGIVTVLESFQIALATIAEARVALRGEALIHELMAEAELRLTGGDAAGGDTALDIRDAYDDFAWEPVDDETVRLPVGLAGTNELHQLTADVMHRGSGRPFSSATYILVRGDHGL